MPPGDRGYDPRDMVSRAVSLTGLPGKDGGRPWLSDMKKDVWLSICSSEHR